MVYVMASGSVVYDGSILTQEEKNNSVMLGRLPVPEKREGFIAVMIVDVEAQSVYYEYEVNTNHTDVMQLSDRVDSQDAVLEEIMFKIIPELMGGI